MSRSIKKIAPTYLADALLQKIAEVNKLFYHLIFLVSSVGEGNELNLHAVTEPTGLHNVNLSLELSSWKLDFSIQNRSSGLNEEPKLLMWYDQAITHTGEYPLTSKQIQ